VFYDNSLHELSEITQNKGIVREFGEITQKDHCAVQGHSRSPIVIQIDFLLLINTN